ELGEPTRTALPAVRGRGVGDIFPGPQRLLWLPSCWLFPGLRGRRFLPPAAGGGAGEHGGLQPRGLRGRRGRTGCRRLAVRAGVQHGGSARRRRPPRVRARAHGPGRPRGRCSTVGTLARPVRPGGAGAVGCAHRGRGAASGGPPARRASGGRRRRATGSAGNPAVVGEGGASRLPVRDRRALDDGPRADALRQRGGEVEPRPGLRWRQFGQLPPDWGAAFVGGLPADARAAEAHRQVGARAPSAKESERRPRALGSVPSPIGHCAAAWAKKLGRLGIG
ncbi:unnamed protein product, partial [Prorocentrum cordatum]